MHKVIHKPWGKEEWLALNEFYCYKRIYLKAGYKTSLQYHEFKKESNYIIEGTAEVWLEKDNGEIEKVLMGPGSLFNVDPPKKHRVCAITDVILQEVSTPHVDDVFRIDDEFKRGNGRIDAEHKSQAVLILAAGLGSRMRSLTHNVNKGLLPINNKAIISHIIEKFDSDSNFVIAVGYKGDSLQEYCQLNYPNYKITYVTVDDYLSPSSGPGYSASRCKEFLQMPFYFITVDCLILDKIPIIDGNWLSVFPTSFPEKYSTIDVDNELNFKQIVNKSGSGFDFAFTGLAAIWNYEVFWKKLAESGDKEIISAFIDPSAYPKLKVKQLEWLDTGNYDDYLHARLHLADNPLSLKKSNGEITYFNDKTNIFLKYIPDEKIVERKKIRANMLAEIIPPNFFQTKNFICYNWTPGSTLYQYDNYDYYSNFINFYFKSILCKSKKFRLDRKLLEKFYIEKTRNRISLFIDNNKTEFFEAPHYINGRSYDSAKEILSRIDYAPLLESEGYELFHGDLQFDNIIFNEDDKSYKLIDWRDGFADTTEGGDIYYDLAKLYGGCIISYLSAKDESRIPYSEGSFNIQFEIPSTNALRRSSHFLKSMIIENGYSFEKVKFLTAIIFINMSPLHDEKFSKMLWFKSIELLNEIAEKNNKNLII